MSVPPPAEKGQTKGMVSLGNLSELVLPLLGVEVLPEPLEQAARLSASAQAETNANSFFIGFSSFLSSGFVQLLLRPRRSPVRTA